MIHVKRTIQIDEAQGFTTLGLGTKKAPYFSIKEEANVIFYFSH